MDPEPTKWNDGLGGNALLNPLDMISKFLILHAGLPISLTEGNRARRGATRRTGAGMS